jgi:hypothetical protein
MAFTELSLSLTKDRNFWQGTWVWTIAVFLSLPKTNFKDPSEQAFRSDLYSQIGVSGFSHLSCVLFIGILQDTDTFLLPGLLINDGRELPVELQIVLLPIYNYLQSSYQSISADFFHLD